MIPRSKTAVPGVPPDVVARPELFAGFDAPGAPGVGLVSAPAGYGKTLALAGWAGGHARTAWVSLDRHDDAHLLWSAILAALVRLPGAAEVRDLAPPRGADDRDFLARFCDVLEVPEPPITLVLDDVHEVGDAAAMSDLRSLVLYRPRGLRLLLSSRYDPPLSLPRLRLEGRLWDLRADRLAFSPAETAVLTERAGLTLSADETRRLQRRTGGWAAGLRLAVQAMRNAESPEAFLAAFSGDDRSVADYLVGEVLDTLPAPTREFLTVASITDPLQGALAVELTAREDAVEVLERLERETSLVEELAGDQHEYRILELLRTYLDAELHRRRPVLAAALHSRAARWWASREAAVALGHAGRGDDPALLAELLDRFALRLALTGNHDPVRRALASTPGDGPPGGAPRTAAAALGAALVLDPEDLRALGTAVAEVLAAGLPDTPVLAVLQALGRGLGDLLSVDLDGARNGLEEALAVAGRHGFDFAAVQCRTLLAYVAAVQGDHVAARTHSGEALGEDAAASAPRSPWEPSPWVTLAHVLHAYAALQQADPETARSMTETALRRPDETLPPTLRFALRVVGGAARADAAEPADGLAEIGVRAPSSPDTRSRHAWRRSPPSSSTGRPCGSGTRPAPRTGRAVSPRGTTRRPSSPSCPRGPSSTGTVAARRPRASHRSWRAPPSRSCPTPSSRRSWCRRRWTSGPGISRPAVSASGPRWPRPSRSILCARSSRPARRWGCCWRSTRPGPNPSPCACAWPSGRLGTRLRARG